MTEKTIMGIDPGTNIMGYGLLKITDNKASMIAMGVIDMRKMHDPYQRLGRIFDRITSLIVEFKPDEMAIEAPFFGKNIQSMLKLGRAQGVAIAAAIHNGIPIHEYAPLKIKMSITGNGNASKEQVAGILQRYFHIPEEMMLPQLDATDGLAAALCHFFQSNNPVSEKKYTNWKDFISKNPDKIKGFK